MPYGDLLPLRPRRQGFCSLPLTRTWGTGETFPDLLGAATGYVQDTRQSPRRFRPAEGADPERGRVGVCMSVDPERHTLTHTHSHARTHAGPSAAPPQTFTPRVRSSRVPRAVPSPCRWLLTKAVGRSRGPGQGDTAGSPHHPPAAVLALPRPPGEGEWGEGARGSYRSGRRVRAGAPGGSRPATSAGPAGTRPEGGPGGGTQGRPAELPRPARGPGGAPPPAPPAQEPERPRGAQRPLPPGWGPPRVTKLFQLCTRGRTRRAPAPTLGGTWGSAHSFASFKSAGKTLRAVSPGRGRSSSARVFVASTVS